MPQRITSGSLPECQEEEQRYENYYRGDKRHGEKAIEIQHRNMDPPERQPRQKNHKHQRSNGRKLPWKV